METQQGGYIHIQTEPHEEVLRRPYGDPRWCFVCRARQPFEYVVMAPIGMSYYGPFTQIECTSCRTVDGDMFPGTQREWEG